MLPRLGACVGPGEEALVQHTVLVAGEGASEAEHQAEHVLSVDHRVKIVDLLLKYLRDFLLLSVFLSDSG